MSWLVSLLALGVLVLVHELGHFIVARRSGVRVTQFSIGFGPKLWSIKGPETEYLICLLPLGGYVKMAGDTPDQVTRQPWEFLAQPIGVRAKIVAAGPLVNYLSSVVLLWIVLVMGYPELRPVVGTLVDGMPAQLAGFKPGDRITGVNGEEVRTWEDVTKQVHRSPDRLLRIQVTRDGQPVQVPVIPKSKSITDPFGRAKIIGQIGVAPSGEIDIYKVPPLQAVRKTFERQREWAGQIGMSLWSLLTGRMSPKDSLTGPIGILHITSEAARNGLGPLLFLASLLSLSLAIFNIFPIPILDGGHLLWLALEKIRGRPVSFRVQERATQVSMALLLTMVVMICINDVDRLGWVPRFLDWIRPD